MKLRIRPVHILLIIALAVTAAGPVACRRRPKPALEGARVHAHAFMAERLRGETAAARGRLSAAGAAVFDREDGPVLDLRQVGDVTALFPVAESTESAGKYRFTYRIHQVGRETPYAAYWDEVVAVGSTGETYHVDDVTVTDGEHEAYVAEDHSVHIRSDGGDGRLFGMDDLPDEFIPQGATPDTVFGVGKEGVALLSFSPLGDRLAFVTWGTHGYLGMIAAAGGAAEGIDLHFEGLTVDVRWSPDSQYIAAVVDEPTGNKFLIAYRLSPRERIALGLEGMFPPEEFDLRYPNWTGPVQFTFEAQHTGSETDAKDGTWLADVAERVVRRPGVE